MRDGVLPPVGQVVPDAELREQEQSTQRLNGQAPHVQASSERPEREDQRERPEKCEPEALPQVCGDHSVAPAGTRTKPRFPSTVMAPACLIRRVASFRPP